MILEIRNEEIKMIEVWYYDKNKQAEKTYPNKLSEYEVADLIKNGLTTT